MVEVTSTTADKTKQEAKEASIRKTGDVFIRDKKTKELYNVTDVKTETIRKD